MTEKASAAGVIACRALLENGYVIRKRNGFPKLIEPASVPMVFRVLENSDGQLEWSFEMPGAAPETGPQALLPGFGS